MGLVEAIVRSILEGMLMPTNFLPAIAIGWLARTAGLAVLGGVAVGVALLAYGGMFAILPAEAEVIWWTLPVVFVPPVVWSWSSFHAFQALRRLAGNDPSHPGLRLVDMLVGALVGAAGFGAAAIALGLLYVELAAVTNFEGAAGYLVVFGFGFPGVVLGVIVGAIVGWRRRRRRPAAG